MARTEAFDRYSSEYEHWFEKNHELYRLELEAVRQLMPVSGLGLEIGAGSGRFACPLGIRLGVEPSATMARLARGKGLDTVIGTAEHLPLKNRSCDFALMVTTVCFVDDVLMSFMEALRILKDRGCFITGLVDRESRLGQCYQERRHTSRFYREATFYSADEIVDYMKQAGFTKFDTRQTLIEDDHDLTEQVLPGTGRGAFVVIKAIA